MKNKVLLITFLMNLCLLGSIHASEFQKIIWWDPYSAMIFGAMSAPSDTTGLRPEQYIDQIDLLGITLSKGVADSLSTHYAASQGLNVKFWGDDGLTINNKSLFFLVALSNVFFANTFENDTLNSYTWDFNGGSDFLINEELAGKIYRSNTDNADTVLTVDGSLLVPTEDGYVYPKFKMRVWDTLTTDTICDVIVRYYDNGLVERTQVYSFIGTDFQGADSLGWKLLIPGLDSSKTNKWSTSFKTKIYWRGGDSLAVNNISFRNHRGLQLEDIVEESLSNDTLKKVYANFYNRIDINHHGRHFTVDEPKPSNFWSIKTVNFHADTIIQNKSLCVTHNFIPSYIHLVEPSEICANIYEIDPIHDSLSEPLDTLLSIQVAYQNFIELLSAHSNNTLSAGVDFTVMIQAGGFLDAEGSRERRDPTDNELVMQGNLAVNYGAVGIAYFVYTSTFVDTIDGFSFPGSDEKFAKFPLSTSDVYEGMLPGTFHGLVDWDFDSLKFIPNNRWYAAKEWHEFIDSIWITLDSLEWKDADNWKNVKSISGSVIDSIYSTDFVDTATYLEVGRFTSTSNEEYYTLVNRRSLSSDSQDVVIEFDNRPGYTKVTDIYTGEVFDVYDSLGTAKLTLHFAPAEMKLIKIENNITEFSGTWSGTWPTYSTINIVGDITIDSGKTLIMNSKFIDVAGFSDATSSGPDPNKVDIIVNGELRIEGTASNRVVLAPDIADTNTWRGIRVNSPSTSYSGKLFMNNVDIKGAYEGVRLSTSGVGDTLRLDTIMYCTFDSCFMSGIKIDKKNCFLSTNTFLNTVNGYGIYLNGNVIDSTTIISSCYFLNIKYPIYAFWASPLITGSDFHFTESATSNGYGQPAIWLQRDSDVKIRSCDINNYKTGVKIDFLSDVDIEFCSFDADSFYVPHQTDTTALMNIALDGVGLSSTCIVRSSCFKLSDSRYIDQGLTTFDLGTTTDLGDNSFKVEIDSYDVNHPIFAIENYSDTTLYALGNYWAVDTSEWFIGSGTIVADSAEQFPSIFYCTDVVEFKIDANIATDEIKPKVFSIAQNYPNPFNPETQILFTLPEISHVKIEIFNVIGQRVKLLLDNSIEAGEHLIQWNSVDDHGNKVSSGVYLYRIEAGDFIETKKMILLK